MSALQWILVVVSWLVSLLISGAALVLASMFRGSGDESDRTIGLVIGAVGVLFLLLPGAGTWLLAKTARTTLGTVLLISAIVVGVAGVGVLWGAIEAAARP
jgi:hypothetical protein